MKKNSLNLKKLVEDITGIENIYSMKGICPEQEPLLCMPQQIEIVEVSKVQAEDNTKKECDHIVGYLVSSSFYCEGSVEIEQIRLSSIDKGRNIDCDYCPECGEKVNWAVIERSLNLKKDE